MQNWLAPWSAWSKIWTRSLSYFFLLIAANPTKLDISLLIGGVVCAIAAGVPFPILGILFGELIDDFNSATCTIEENVNSVKDMQSSVNRKVLLIFIIGVVQFVLMYTHLACWSLSGARLSHRLRDQYLRNVLRRNVLFFESLPSGTVSTRLTSDIQTILTGTSEKAGLCISSASFFVTAFVVAFTRDVKLAAMLISLIPAYLLMSLVGTHYIEKYSIRIGDFFTTANNVASEALDNIPIVHAFSASEKLARKFSLSLFQAKHEGIKKALATGIQAGLLYFIAYAGNALAFWWGSTVIANDVDSNDGAPSVGKYYTVIFLLVEGQFCGGIC